MLERRQKATLGLCYPDAVSMTQWSGSRNAFFGALIDRVFYWEKEEEAKFWILILLKDQMLPNYVSHTREYGWAQSSNFWYSKELSDLIKGLCAVRDLIPHASQPGLTYFHRPGRQWNALCDVGHSVTILGYWEGFCRASGLSSWTSVIIVGIWASARE